MQNVHPTVIANNKVLSVIQTQELVDASPSVLLYLIQYVILMEISIAINVCLTELLVSGRLPYVQFTAAPITSTEK